MSKFLLKHYKPVFFYTLRNPHGMPTFKIEALHLVSNVQLVKRLLPGKYSISLLFFGSNSSQALLLRPHPSIVLIASAIQTN